MSIKVLENDCSKKSQITEFSGNFLKIRRFAAGIAIDPTTVSRESPDNSFMGSYQQMEGGTENRCRFEDLQMNFMFVDVMVAQIEQIFNILSHNLVFFLKCSICFS